MPQEDDPLAPLVPDDGGGASAPPIEDSSGTGLAIFLGILKGPLYRAIDGQGPYFPVTYRMDCPLEGPESGVMHDAITPWDFRADEAEPDEFSYLSPDGRTLRGTVESAGMYEWNLAAVRE